MTGSDKDSRERDTDIDKRQTATETENRDHQWQEEISRNRQGGNRREKERRGDGRIWNMGRGGQANTKCKYKGVSQS